MKILDIEIAVMSYLDVRTKLVVPNVSWGMFMHECDLLSLNMNGYATEIEIKTSRQDIRNEKKKKHNHDHEMIKHLYFAVPEELREFALENIPERAGLYVIGKNSMDHLQAFEVRKSKPRKGHKQWTDKQRLQLARLGTMRILGLKQKLHRQLNTEQS